jgi:tRNA-Thr(GGU) m(6)t(6)A37 methyltransferase TsaA
MQMEEIILRPIGVIRTPYQNLEGMPIQPGGARSVEGDVVLDRVHEEGLRDIDGFSHLILIYQFHHSKGFKLTVTPFLDHRERGLFATRAPRRPTPIGLSVVSLLGRSGNVLRVGHIDVVDGTPLIDIKPFVPAFDAPDVTSVGWLKDKAEQSRVVCSDKRFRE